MAQYYLAAGKHDSIRIDIPKGTYVPVFEKRPHAQATDRAIDREHLDIRVKSSWPAVLIRPLSNISGDSELDFWGIGLATELADELNRYPDIRVMTLRPGNRKRKADQTEAQFVIDGNVRSDGTCLKMTVQLTDTRTGRLIWSESCRSSVEAARLIAFQEEIARGVAVKIAGQHGWIAKSLDKRSQRHRPQHSDVYEAVLRYYEYDLTMTPAAFSRALTALEKAVSIDPECGSAWSMLARIFADIYAFDVAGFKDPLEKAFEFGQNGTRLSPDDQRGKTIMAFVHLFRNDLQAGLAEAERALNLESQTLFMLDGIGYLMTLMGAWERGPALIEKVIRLNPFYGNYVHQALWINCLRQKNYAEAYHETLKLNRPTLFWDHLARASTYGLLGNIEDGRKAAAELLKLKPEFTERGRILIGHFIKFEDIVERVIKGLKAVGIEVR
jgi:TolB-like protein